MVCLTGVHVEAQGPLSVTRAVTLALVFYYASRGAPFPQQKAELKTGKVRALCMCCCVTSLFHLLLSICLHSLRISFSFRYNWVYLIKNWTGWSVMCCILCKKKKCLNMPTTKFFNQVYKLNSKQVKGEPLKCYVPAWYGKWKQHKVTRWVW